MRKARVMVGAGTDRRMTRPDGTAASRPESGIPAPIIALKAALVLQKAQENAMMRPRRSTVLFAMAYALFAPALLRAADAQDKDIEEAIRKLGGEVTRDEKAEGKPVIGVRLDGLNATDAGLKELKELKNLRSLNLRATRVTDAGAAELQNALPKLKIRR